MRARQPKEHQREQLQELRRDANRQREDAWHEPAEPRGGRRDEPQVDVRVGHDLLARVEPVYATTSTSNDAWSASDSAWYCMRGERPKSPSTTTCTRRRGPAGARDDLRRRDAAMMNARR